MGQTNNELSRAAKRVALMDMYRNGVSKDLIKQLNDEQAGTL